MYLISACLIGKNCKYDGSNNAHKIAKKLFDKGLVIPVCPEELGGLPTPRDPSEISGDKIINNKNVDVTKHFYSGASNTLEIALKNKIKIAIFQKRSPSCGVNQIYDGSFTGRLIQGEGFTTSVLRKAGIEVITIDEYIKKYYKRDFK